MPSRGWILNFITFQPQHLGHPNHLDKLDQPDQPDKLDHTDHTDHMDQKSNRTTGNIFSNPAAVPY